MSALFDRENPPRRHPRDTDDNTAEISVPAAVDPDDLESGDGSRRLRPTARTRRIQAIFLLAAYAPASLGSTWLLFLALLRLNLAVMIVMTGALVWFVPDTVRLARWLHRLDHGAPRPLLSHFQGVAASLLTGVYAWLLIDWLLHR